MTIENFNGTGTEWYSIVMNGISKYHSGIIDTGMCTIEDFSGTGWYSIFMKGISKYHSGIIATGMCIIENLNMVLNAVLTEWYSVVMNHNAYFQIPFGVSLRPANVPLRTSVVLNGIQ